MPHQNSTPIVSTRIVLTQNTHQKKKTLPSNFQIPTSNLQPPNYLSSNMVDLYLKKVIALVFVMCYVNIAFSQNKEWALVVDGFTDVDPTATAVDSKGNAYFTFIYTNDITIQGFDKKFPKSPYVASLLLKVSPEGKPIWAHTLVGAKDCRIVAIAVDSKDDIYLTGHTDGLTTFTDKKGKQELGDNKQNYPGFHLSGIFIASYSGDGHFKFAQLFRGGWGVGLSIDVNTKGDIYTTLYHQYDLKDINEKTIIPFQKGPQKAYGRAIVVLDAKGNLKKSHSLGWEPTETYTPFFRGKFNSKDQYCLYGMFVGSVALNDSITIETPYQESQDSYIALFDTTFNLLWHRKIGGLNVQRIYDVAFDAKNGIYFTGNYTSECIITKGIQVISQEGHPHRYGTDFFYGRFFPNGDTDFIFYHTNEQNGYSILAHQVGVDINGDAHLVGNYNDTLSIQGKNIFAGFHNPQPYKMIWKRDQLLELDQIGSNPEHFIHVFQYDVNNEYYAGCASYYGEKGTWGKGKNKIKMTSKDHGRAALIYGGRITKKQQEEETPEVIAQQLQEQENIQKIEPFLACLVESTSEEWIAIPSENPLLSADSDSTHSNSDASLNATPCDIETLSMNAKLYPNPTRDNTQLELTGAQNQSIEITVYDERGALLLQKTIAQALAVETLTFDFSTLSPGTYFFRIRSENHLKLERLVLVR